MFVRCTVLLVGLIGVCATSASVTITVDILDPSDGGSQPPDGVLCVDVFVDVTPQDTWTTGGVLAFAQNGAAMRYAHDPNTGSIILINPGTDNRFVTFVSKPRQRDSDQRYTNGQAAILGGWGYQWPHILPSLVSVGFVANPPETSGSPSVDGYVLRLAIDLPVGVPPSSLQVFQGTAPPSALLVSRPLSEIDQYGTVSQTFDVAYFTGLDWYVASIPEPEGLTLLALLAFVAIRRT